MGSNFEEQPVLIERKVYSVKYFFTAIFFIVVIAGVALGLYWYYTDVIGVEIRDSGETGSVGQFEETLTDVASQVGHNDEQAARSAAVLVENSQNDYEEGRAKLLLGLTQLRYDRTAAIKTFKEISIHEGYHLFTRARSVWYATLSYLNTDNQQIATNHIFTGPVWEDFLPNTDKVTKDDLQDAAVGALQYSLSLYTTPQAISQLAVIEAEQLLTGTISVEEKRNKIASIFGKIEAAQSMLNRVDTVERDLYAGTSFVVWASTLDNMAVTLDLLRHIGADVSSDQVEAAYRSALTYATTHELNTTDDEYRIRYHLADYLLRDDPNLNREEIIELLTPMSSLSTQSYLARSFYHQFEGDLIHSDESSPRSVVNVARLADISEEFMGLLLASGVEKTDLSSYYNDNNTEQD